MNTEEYFGCLVGCQFTQSWEWARLTPAEWKECKKRFWISHQPIIVFIHTLVETPKGNCYMSFAVLAFQFLVFLMVTITLSVACEKILEMLSRNFPWPSFGRSSSFLYYFLWPIFGSTYTLIRCLQQTVYWLFICLRSNSFPTKFKQASKFNSEFISTVLSWIQGLKCSHTACLCLMTSRIFFTCLHQHPTWMILFQYLFSLLKTQLRLYNR